MTAFNFQIMHFEFSECKDIHCRFLNHVFNISLRNISIKKKICSKKFSKKSRFIELNSVPWRLSLLECGRIYQIWKQASIKKKEKKNSITTNIKVNIACQNIILFSKLPIIIIIIII